MLDLQGALAGTGALGQVASLVARYVVSLVLPLVARLAEVSVAPAEPLGDLAAELALEFDEISAVLLAVLLPRRVARCGALATNQLFWLELLGLFLRSVAILHPTEVGAFALVALVVTEFEQSEALQVIIEAVALLFQAFVLVKVFELCSLESLLDHFFLKLLSSGQLLRKFRDVVCLDPLLAGRAAEEAESDTRRGPALLDVGH